MLDPLTLSTDLVRIETELAFAIRTSGACRSEVEGLRVIHASLVAAVRVARFYERLVQESPPFELSELGEAVPVSTPIEQLRRGEGT